MAASTRAALKALWITGYKPTQTDYENLFDSFFALLDDSQIFRPATEPAVASTILTLDCENNNSCIFEPTPRPIVANFSFAAFSNITGTDVIQVNLNLTGTLVISFGSNIQVSNPSSLGTWDDVLKELTITAGTADEIEFNFLWHKAAAVWVLSIGEVSG